MGAGARGPQFGAAGCGPFRTKRVSTVQYEVARHTDAPKVQYVLKIFIKGERVPLAPLVL